MDNIELCKAYIHSVFCMEGMKDGGFMAIYGLEQQRIRAHEKLCDAIGIDYEISKDICLFLDREIGMDYSTYPSESVLNNLAHKLLNKLEALK